jgi:hypothetical protein
MAAGGGGQWHSGALSHIRAKSRASQAGRPTRTAVVLPNQRRADLEYQYQHGRFRDRVNA